MQGVYLMHMKQNRQAKIIKPQQLTSLRYPLKESWIKAAGLLRYKRKALGNHLRKVHTEWNHLPS